MTKEERIQQLEQIEKICLNRIMRIAKYAQTCSNVNKIRAAFVVVRLVNIVQASKIEKIKVSYMVLDNYQFAPGGVIIPSPESDSHDWVIPGNISNNHIVHERARSHSKRHKNEILEELQKLTVEVYRSIDEQNKRKQGTS